MSVPIDSYCADPSAYTSELSPSTRKYYDSICKARQSLNKQYYASKGDKISEAIFSIPYNLIESFLSPSGLQILGVTMGITVGPKLLGGAILRGMAKGLGEPLLDFSADLAAKEGSYIASNAIMTTIISEAAGEASIAATAAEIIEAIGDAVSAVGELLILVNILSLVFDALDLGGFSQELTGSSLQKIVDQFNLSFANIVLTQLSTVETPNGEKITVRPWPVEYFADNTEWFGKAVGNPNRALCANTGGKCSYQLIYARAYAQYLLSLKNNSDGFPIIWPKGGELLNESDLQRLGDHIDYILGDQNVVVASWIKRWWIVIIVVAILLIIFILAIG